MPCSSYSKMCFVINYIFYSKLTSMIQHSVQKLLYDHCHAPLVSNWVAHMMSSYATRNSNGLTPCLSPLNFFFNLEISSLKNQKINLITKLIFAGYIGSKNQVQTRKKIKFDSKSIFFFEFVINSQIDISKIKHR